MMRIIRCGNSRSNRAPVLDEDDDDGDIPLPSHIVRDQINVSDLREATGNDSISDWARQNIGDTHLGKRKLQKGPKKGDPKRRKGKQTAKPVSSDTETDDGDIPLPFHIVRDEINLSDLREATGDDSISDWARKNVGDTHLGKRKLQKGPMKGDPKRRKGKATAKTSEQRHRD